MDLSSITGIFYFRLIETILLLAICVAIFFFVRGGVKHDNDPKWLYIIWALGTMFIAFFTVKGVVDLRTDIHEQSFVIYQGEFINRGGGQKDLKTVVIYDDSCKEIKLLGGAPVAALDVGTYTGEVVYGSRSKIIVEITSVSSAGD